VVVFPNPQFPPRLKKLKIKIQGKARTQRMAAAADYEAQRRRQIEENKRRIEELGLRHLAAATMPPKVPKVRPGFSVELPA
jgi:hypothetical protein